MRSYLTVCDLRVDPPSSCPHGWSTHQPNRWLFVCSFFVGVSFRVLTGVSQFQIIVFHTWQHLNHLRHVLQRGTSAGGALLFHLPLLLSCCRSAKESFTDWDAFLHFPILRFRTSFRCHWQTGEARCRFARVLRTSSPFLWHLSCQRRHASFKMLVLFEHSVSFLCPFAS